MKRCSVCKAMKPFTEFYPKVQKSGKMWYRAECKACKLSRRQEIRSARAGKPDLTIKRRFWAKVDKRGPADCWNWLGAKSNRGYGAISYQGADCPAHRVSMQLAGHEVFYPALVVDHLCKNIACVNPAHLRVTTQRINATENSTSPLAENARKTHCPKGHPYSRENTAIEFRPQKVMPDGRRRGKCLVRTCLTCYPARWRFAIIERKPPKGARFPWVGPPAEWVHEGRNHP